MRSLITIGLLGIVAAGIAGPQADAQATDDIFPFETRRIDLDNGLRAYFVDCCAPGQIAFVSMVRTGARDEVEEGKTGFAHFFEHMMFRGTDKYPDYDAATETMGAARNAFTSNDYTVYYLVVASEYLEQVMDLESDRFQNLGYSEAEFRTEAGAILGEYQNSAYTPVNVLDRMVRATAFDEHTYGHQTIGLEADIRAMPEGYEYSLDFHDRFYRPENVVLVVAGDLDFGAAESMVREYYAGWEPGYRAPDVPVEPEQTAPRDRVVEYNGSTLPIVSINYKAPAWSADEKSAVATEVLGDVAFGPNSDIYRELVIEEQRVQYLFPGFGLSRDPGLVTIQSMVTEPGDVDAVEAELLAAVERAREEPVDPELLADTKSNLRYSFLMGLETAQNVAFSLIGTVINTGGIEAIDDYYRTLEEVTADDVREAARRFLTEDRRTIVTLVEADQGGDGTGGGEGGR